MKSSITLCLMLLFFGFAPSALPTEMAPDPNTVQWWGPAYRYSLEGWISVHIEGEPYDRGEQHGRLLAPEIAAYVQALAEFTNPKSPLKAWELTRHLVKNTFLHGFTQEQVAEMNGIAAGASASGARFNGRPLDLLDIAALNLANELDSYESALAASAPHIRENQKPSSEYLALNSAQKKTSKGPIRCDAFAATGPATKDGKIVFGHLTMFSLYPANFYNVWLEVKPTHGHRFVMQTSPGNIQSGMDYSINDAGILLSETTVAQTSFEPQGIPLAARIRQAQQYAETIEQAAAMLSEKSNGLSTTEWILGDIKNNEIALLTLGTHRSKLYRSSQKEWIAGAEGFYWSNNSTKDRDVRLETIPDKNDRPSAIAALRTTSRDAIWLRMYDQYKGQIDADFAKRLLTTPEIVMSMSVDAKYTTSQMASKLQTWASFGPPLGAVRYPSPAEQRDFPAIKPLVSNPWVKLQPTQLLKTANKQPVDLPNPEASHLLIPTQSTPEPETQPAWHGTLLPKDDAAIWLTTAFANYERIIALEHTLQANAPLSQQAQDLLATKVFYYRSRYELAARARHDFPLAQTQANFRDDLWYDLVSGKGVLLLHALRKRVGAAQFDRLMDDFGRTHSLQEVSSQQFQTYLEHKTGTDLHAFFETWLNTPGLPHASETLMRASPFTIFSFDSELEKSLIIYGTLNEATVNKEAASVLQQALRRRKHNYAPPIKTDTEVSQEELKTHHLIFIGRPDSNRLMAAEEWKWPVRLALGSFQLRETLYAHPESALLMAIENPFNPRFSSVISAGLSPLGTLQATRQFAEGSLPNAPIVVLPNQQAIQALVLP